MGESMVRSMGNLRVVSKFRKHDSGSVDVSKKTASVRIPLECRKFTSGVIFGRFCTEPMANVDSEACRLLY